MDERGQRAWSAKLSSYGQLRHVEGPRAACPFRYPGQYEDAETGLYYNRFRCYDPHAGAYIFQDPADMITNFRETPDKLLVSWESEGKVIALYFSHRAFANHIEYLNQILVQSDARESGSCNLWIYQADGTVKARPQMPALQHEVGGVYAVWFDQGNRFQTLVLMTDELKPYDTACTFDLETYVFSDFRPTK